MVLKMLRLDSNDCIASTMPRVLQNDKFTNALAKAINIQLNNIFQKALSYADTSDLSNMPERFLDHLAYEKHVDYYEETMTKKQKIALIENSVEWHRRKGTKWAIEFVVSLFFERSVVVEWFDYDADPFYFTVEIYPKTFKSGDTKRLREMIYVAKNARSWFSGFTLMLFDYVMEQIDLTYHYPVTFPRINEIAGKAEMSLGKIGTDVHTDQAYQYDVLYPRKSIAKMDLKRMVSEMTSTAYAYVLQHRLCGQFACEGGQEDE